IGVGVNWTLAMEAGLRAMSICFSLNLLSPFHRDEQRWLASVTRSLVQHLLYIEANLEFSYFLTSNHYLGDVVGLYCLSMFLDTLASTSGELPQVGDCDDGRTELLVDDLRQMILCPVGERNSLRVSHLLGLGQRLFGEGKGPGDDAAWYGLTETGRAPYSKP